MTVGAHLLPKVIPKSLQSTIKNEIEASIFDTFLQKANLHPIHYSLCFLSHFAGLKWSVLRQFSRETECWPQATSKQLLGIDIFVIIVQKGAKMGS